MESSPEDWEKARKISDRLKRINLIRRIKNDVIEMQAYELAAFVRDIERSIEKEEPLYLWDDGKSVDFIYDKLQKYFDGISKNEEDWIRPTKDYLKSLLREYKIESILIKKPL